MQVEPVDIARIEETPPSENRAATTAEVAARVVRARGAPHALTVESAVLASLGHRARSSAHWERALRVARTIARLESANLVTPAHMTEALPLADSVDRLYIGPFPSSVA